MKGINILIVICFVLFLPNTVWAATRYWIGPSGGSFGANANWSTTTGGSADTTAPGSGDVATFDGGGVNNCAIDANINVGGIDINTGYTGTITQNTDKTVTIGSSNYDQADGTFSGGNSTIDLNGAFGLSGGTFTSTSGTMTVSGAWTHTSGGTFTHNSGTVETDGGGATRTWDFNSSESFNHFKMRRTGGWDLDIADGDTVLVLGTTTFDSASGSTILAGGTLEMRGDITFVSGSDCGVVAFLISGSNNQNMTLTGSEATCNGNITINKSAGTVTLNSDLTMDTNGQDLLVQGGTLDLNGKVITVDDDFNQSGGTLTGGTGTLDTVDFILSSGTFNAPTTTKVAGAWTHTSGGTFNHNSGTVDFDGSGVSPVIDVNSSETLNHVNFKKTGGWDLDITTGDTVLVLGTFRSSSASGSILLAGGTLEFRGDFTIDSGSDCGSVTLLASGSNNQTMTLTGSEAVCDGDITVNKSGGAVTLASALTVNASNQDLTIQEGTFKLAGNNLTVNGGSGKLIIEDGGNLQLRGSETITANSGYPQLDSGSTVTYDSTSGTNTIKDYSYHHLTFNGSGGTFNLGANESTAGNTTITAGTFATAGYNMTVTGTFSNSGTFRVQGNETLTLTMDTDSGTVEYVGDGDGSAETFTLRETGATDFYHLTINDVNATKDTFNAGSASNMAGTLTVTSGTMTHGGNIVTAVDISTNGGTFTGGSANINISGPFALSSGTFTSTSGTLFVSGNFAHSGGTFTHNSGTVTLDGGNQILSGATTFNNLTKTVVTAQTLTFPSASATVISGTATLKGVLGQLLSLRSNTDNSQTSVDFAGSKSFEFLDVKDNNNTNSNNAICVKGCTNSNGNTKWKFIADMTVTLSLSGSPTAENSGVATITATLPEASNQTTTVNLSFSGTATLTDDYTRSSASITINAGDTTGTATVTGVNDALDEDNETVIIDISSVTNATESGTQQVTVTITDDDTTPTVTISANNASIAEGGGTSTITGTLSAASAKNVTINLLYSGTATLTSDYTRSGTTISISAGGTTGTVTVTGVDDSLDEAGETIIVDVDTITNATESGTQQLTVTLTDDDSTPSVQFTTTGQTVNENAATATITAQLSAVSGQNVSVPFSAHVNSTATATSDYTLPSSPVTITAGQTSVNISVTIVDDGNDEDDETILIDMGTPTAASQGTNTRHTITITDNDTAGILLTHSSSATSVTEGGITDTYTVQLNTKPTQNVSINVNPDAQTTTDLATLTFTSSNWNTAQTITVTAVDDKIDEDNHSSKIAHKAASSDSKYAALTADLTATVVDNDTAGVSLTEINGAIEEGGSSQYKIVLTTQPVSDVKIAISPDKQTSVATSEVQFTATNWNTAQSVTVTVKDDKFAEGNHKSTVAHTMNSSDSKYQGLTVNSVIVDITDNDTAGVNMLNLDEGVTITRGGAVNRISIILTSEPVSDVVVKLDSGDGLAFDPAELTFSASHWNTEQIAEAYLAANVTVSGESASIAATVQSSDTGYNSIAVASLSVKLSTGSSEIDTNSANCSDDKAFEGSEYMLGKTCDGLSDFSGDFLWTQVSGQTVTLNNADTLYATFTMPENNSAALVFEITALQDDAEVFSDSMKISAIKKNITLKKAKEITEFSGDEIKGGTSTPVLQPDKEVLVAKSGRTITTTDKTASGGGYVLELGNGVELHSGDPLPRNNVVVMDNNIAVGVPDANHERGLVVLISAEITNQTYDLDDEKLVFKDGILAVTDGLKVGKRFGYPIMAGKNEEDGLLVFSLGDGSGSDYGDAFILDSETLDLLNFIKGSEDKILTDQNVYERFGPSDDLSRAILGVTSSGDISANVGSYLSSDQTSIKPNTLQILPKDLTDQFDFNVDEALSNIPTDGIFYAGSGDINGDGFADLVVVFEECDVTIYLSDGAGEENEGYFAEENNLLCSEGTTVTSVAVGDLDSDGIDDIAFGFSDLNRIMVFFGTTELSTLSVLEDNAVIIGGAQGTQTIGEWLVIGDESTIHTGDGSGGTISFSLYASAFIQDIEGEDDGGSAAVGPGGFGCSLSVGHQTNGNLFYFMLVNLILILFFLLWLKMVRNTQTQLKTRAAKISSDSRFQSP